MTAVYVSEILPLPIPNLESVCCNGLEWVFCGPANKLYQLDMTLQNRKEHVTPSHFAAICFDSLSRTYWASRGDTLYHLDRRFQQRSSRRLGLYCPYGALSDLGYRNGAFLLAFPLVAGRLGLYPQRPFHPFYQTPGASRCHAAAPLPDGGFAVEAGGVLYCFDGSGALRAKCLLPEGYYVRGMSTHSGSRSLYLLACNAKGESFFILCHYGDG